jgi:hypothetical protein
MLRAFGCNVKNSSFPATIIYHTTAGKAKYKFWVDVAEAWPDVKYTDITVFRYKTSGDEMFFRDFARTAINRDVPFARVGMSVEVGGFKGEIAGKNSSANFDILFLEGPHKGLILNCHPNWRIKYFDVNGKLIKEFNA